VCLTKLSLINRQCFFKKKRKKRDKKSAKQGQTPKSTQNIIKKIKLQLGGKFVTSIFIIISRYSSYGYREERGILNGKKVLLYQQNHLLK